ncbi:nucleoside triphosphate pyrophosphohydrolase family protein [Rickettsiales endosymbiont of Stachyamoeba lipophora]|nr:hypothetical protein [Rickettsiales endosymbiont of Stachyamoeba lipophora]
MNPLNKLLEIERQAADFGFNWPGLQMIFDQIASECDEIKESITNHPAMI